MSRDATISLPPQTVRVLFDEFHSESWTASAARAREFNPANPFVSSYQKAADALACRDFAVSRNVDHPLLDEALAGADVLILPHPCDPKWERTTSTNWPKFSASEIEHIQ